MKKLFLCIFASIMLVIPVLANQVVVNLLDGRAIKGELISQNDSALVIKKSARK